MCSIHYSNMNFIFLWKAQIDFSMTYMQQVIRGLGQLFISIFQKDIIFKNIIKCMWELEGSQVYNEDYGEEFPGTNTSFK